jgi:FeS assembly protein IscX
VYLLASRAVACHADQREKEVCVLSWRQPTDIAWALLDAYPEADPLDLNFVDLHRMITALPQFDDDPNAASESVLEAIVMAWHDQR